MNKIKVINDIGDLVTVFTISNTDQKKKILSLLNEKWIMEEDLKAEFGEEGVKFLKYLEKIKFIESQWTNTPKGPKKIYHNYYDSIQIDVILPTSETCEVLYVASMSDEEVDNYSAKIEELLNSGIQYVGEIQTKLGVSLTFLRGIIKRSKNLVLKGMKVERLQ